MTDQTQFFGFRIPEALYLQAGEHIDRVIAGDIDRTLVENIAASLMAITDTGLVAYYNNPRDLIRISPVVKKAADAGIQAVMMGIHLVIRMVINRAPDSELQMMALYMKTLLTSDGQGHY
ncbi:MAG: hypothetical protein R3208_21470, partial [Ketobacteraceae bacterium]|nr:hypothetical protein [Ketobacteraceae bacterium]